MATHSILMNAGPVISTILNELVEASVEIPAASLSPKTAQ